MCESSNNWLEFSKPGISHDGPQDGREIAEGHKCVVYGCGQVIVPLQEVLKVQHQYSCGEAAKTSAITKQTDSI